MPLKQLIKEKMIPIKNYATIAPGATLIEAAISLRTSFCELDGSRIIILKLEDFRIN